MKILVERRCHGMFDGGLHGVGGKSRTQAFPKTGSSSPFVGLMTELSDPCVTRHSGDRLFAESRVLPVLSIWVGAARRVGRSRILGLRVRSVRHRDQRHN